MKVISKKLLRKKNNVQYMKSERDILTRLQHPFIVQLHFAFQSEGKLFLVMDFLGGGELFHLLRYLLPLNPCDIQMKQHDSYSRLCKPYRLSCDM
jgi:serine/threonine protein kinase